MSKSKSIDTDLAELHDNNNELYEALHDEDYPKVKVLCDKGIKAYRDIISTVRKNIQKT